MHSSTGSGALHYVEIAPHRGAAVSAFYTRFADGVQRHWLHPADNRFPACFPVVPWCSRLRNGRFQFKGRDYRVAANQPPGVHPIHGHGWLRRWQVRQQQPHGVLLEYVYAGDRSWPWDYVAELAYELSGAVLQVQIRVHNLTDEAMPAGAGLHPFFSRTGSTRVSAQIDHAWRMDKAGFPAAPLRSAAPGSDGSHPLERQLADGLRVADKALDTVCSGWRGAAEIYWPEWHRGLRMEASSNLRELVLWTPSQYAYFCVEPLSGLVDSAGFLTIGPDETMEFTVQFTLLNANGEIE